MRPRRGVSAAAVVAVGSVLLAACNSAPSLTSSAVHRAVHAYQAALAKLPETSLARIKEDGDQVASQLHSFEHTLKLKGLNPNTTAYTILEGKIGAASGAQITLARAAADRQANLSTLSKAFGLSATTVAELAHKAGVTLNGTLSTAQVSVLEQEVNGTTPTTTVPATIPPATTSSTTTAVPAGCHPLSDETTCYEPGEYCRDRTAGVSGVAGDGEQISCETNDGLRWEPT